VVDHDGDNRRLFARRLERVTSDVATVRTGTAALDWLGSQAEVPALIVVDLVLPDMHGSELVAMLRGLPRTAQVPILAVTGLADEPRCPGADAHLVKPFSMKRFDLVVSQLLKPGSRRGPQPELEPTLRTRFVRRRGAAG
jgi:CheY-like chemotaxis protein